MYRFAWLLPLALAGCSHANPTAIAPPRLVFESNDETVTANDAALALARWNLPAASTADVVTAAERLSGGAIDESAIASRLDASEFDYAEPIGLELGDVAVLVAALDGAAVPAALTDSTDHLLGELAIVPSEIRAVPGRSRPGQRLVNDFGENVGFALLEPDGVGAEVVDASELALTSLEGIEAFPNLVDIDVSQNRITSVAPLMELTAISVLDISDNQVTSLVPLLSSAGIGAGDRVIVSGNPLDARSVDDVIPALQFRGVTVLF